MVIARILLIGMSLLLLSQQVISQERVFSRVQKLSSAINSDAEESLPLLSADGKTLYFSRFIHPENAGGKYSGQDIWLSRFDGTAWTTAERLFGLNNKNHNAVIGTGTDGKVLYLLNASLSKEIKTISFSKNVNGIWTKPEAIPLGGLDHQGFIGFYVSPDFEVILLSMKGADSKGEEDIYVCLKNQSGEWMRPKNLGAAINTPGFEISPFLSSDKKRLYFSSNGHRGLGDGDIFYSERLYNSWETWTVPKNLGDKINSPGFDAYLSVYDNVAYFASNRNGEFADLYTAAVGEAIDSTELQVKKIVEEAHSLLGDLSGQSSSDRELKSIFIEFNINSWNIDTKGAGQLDSILGMLKRGKLTDITLSPYSTGNSPEEGNKELFNRRINSVKDYLAKSGLFNQKMSQRAENTTKTGPGRKNGVVLQYYLLE